MDKRNAHEPLYCSLVLFFIGSLVYASAEAFGEINGGKEAILVSRIITGISTGIIVNIFRMSVPELRFFFDLLYEMSFLDNAEIFKIRDLNIAPCCCHGDNITIWKLLKNIF